MIHRHHSVVKQDVAVVYLVRYGHAEAFIVRAAEGVQELAQVVDQQWHVNAVQAGCCHSSIM